MDRRDLEPSYGLHENQSGCKNCYAERLARRLKAMGNPRYCDGFAVRLHPDQLSLPLHWRKPRRIFVNSMSDLFHDDVPDDYIIRVFDVMVRADWHIFQILTKRSERLARLGARLPWPLTFGQASRSKTHATPSAFVISDRYRHRSGSCRSNPSRPDSRPSTDRYRLGNRRRRERRPSTTNGSSVGPRDP